MEPIIELKPDTVTVIAEPGALTFATRKQWTDLPAEYLEELQGHNITRIYQGKKNSVYFLLYNNNPINYLSGDGNYSSLVKISPDEKGNLRFMYISLTAAESAMLRRNKGLDLWE